MLPAVVAMVAIVAGLVLAYVWPLPEERVREEIFKMEFALFKLDGATTREAFEEINAQLARAGARSRCYFTADPDLRDEEIRNDPLYKSLNEGPPRISLDFENVPAYDCVIYCTQLSGYGWPVATAQGMWIPLITEAPHKKRTHWRYEYKSWIAARLSALKSCFP